LPRGNIERTGIVGANGATGVALNQPSLTSVPKRSLRFLLTNGCRKSIGESACGRAALDRVLFGQETSQNRFWRFIAATL
jgi:hypothetical protein